MVFFKHLMKNLKHPDEIPNWAEGKNVAVSYFASFPLIWVFIFFTV